MPTAIDSCNPSEAAATGRSLDKSFISHELRPTQASSWKFHDGWDAFDTCRVVASHQLESKAVILDTSNDDRRVGMPALPSMDHYVLLGEADTGEVNEANKHCITHVRLPASGKSLAPIAFIKTFTERTGCMIDGTCKLT